MVMIHGQSSLDRRRPATARAAHPLRARSPSRGPNSYVHVLGGLRYDTAEGESNTAYGGMAGLGVDIPAGSSLFVRLGADFQMFFDEGENLKTLRLTAGISF
jgi:hypothetical protein